MEKPKKDFGYLEALKRYVLTKAGIQVLSPGDCRTIAFKIEEATGKVVSETTLKRFLGFAKKNYNFSTYTLNALCDYIGFAGWDTFQSSMVPETTTRSADVVWQEFKKKSLEISTVSLQNLKDHSGVPFGFTMSRPAIEADFELFMEEDYPCFGLIGTTGIGKSIQMAHLAQKYFLNEEAPHKNSILWLFKKGALFDFIPHDIYLEESLYEQFGLRSEFNFIDYFRHKPEAVQGRLVLMMDGFDEYLSDPDRLNRVFQQFADLLSYVKDLSWVKIVYTLRPANWDLLRSKMDQSAFLRKQWFPGLSYQKELNVNLRPLHRREVDKIFEKVRQSGITNSLYHNKLYDLLKYPVFLTTYFQYIDRNPSSSGTPIGDVLCFQLLSSYLNDRVNRSHFNVEKWFLIKRSLLLSEYGKCENGIEEADLLSGLFDDSTHIMAYRELVKAGIFQQEQKRKTGGRENFRVRFVNRSLFVYLLATVLADNHKDGTIAELCRKIREEYKTFPDKTLLLKGVFWHLLDRHSDEVLEVFSDFPAEEKGTLFLFICDYAQAYPKVFEPGKWTAFIQEATSFLSTHLLYINELNKSYDTAVDHLIGITGADTEKANLLVIRALLSFLRLDQDTLYKVKTQIKNLKGVNLKKTYPIHPVELIEFVLTIKPGQSAVDELPKPFESFIARRDRTKENTINNEGLLSYQLGGLVLQLCFVSKAFLLFTEKIKGLHPQLLSSKEHHELRLFLEVQEAFVHVKNGGSQIEGLLKQLNGKSDLYDTDSKSTCYSRILFLLLKGERAVKDKDIDHAIHCLQKGYEVCKTNNYTLLQLMIALKLIGIYKLAERFDQPADLIKDIRQKTVHLTLPIRELFLQRAMTEVN